jgi:hypothetical protein
MLVLFLVLASALGLHAESGSGLAIGAGATATAVVFIPLDSLGYGGTVTLDVPGAPIRIGLNAMHWLDNRILCSLSVDYLLIERRGVGMFGWYLGIGGLVQAGINVNDGDVLTLSGVRVPVAVQLWPGAGGKLEVFLEAAPAWVPIITNSEEGLVFGWMYVMLQPSLGVRWRF